MENNGVELASLKAMHECVMVVEMWNNDQMRKEDTQQMLADKRKQE